jgi:hypothetical protein
MKRIKPDDDPQHGRRLNWHEDLDFRSFLNSSDWVEPDHEFALDPRHQAGGEPTLACQGDYASDVSPLRFGRVLTEIETEQAALPLIVAPEPPPPPARPFAKPVRISTQGGWERRGGFAQCRGRLFRSHGSKYEWRVSLRPSPWGYVVYLRTVERVFHDGRTGPPLTPLGALNDSSWDRRQTDPDYALVDAGESAYIPELLFVPTLAAAKQLAVKCAWQYVRPLPQQHPPPLSFRWMRIRP